MTATSKYRKSVLVKHYRLTTPWAVGLLISLIIAAYWPTISVVADAWTRPRGFHAHGFLVLGMVGMLLWGGRHKWMTLPKVSMKSLETGYASRLTTSHKLLNLFWWAGIFGSISLWFLGWSSDVQIVAIVAVLGIIICSGCLMLGHGSLQGFGLPISILLFALPIWYNVSSILQAISAKATETIVGFLGLTAHVNGIFITIPNGVFEIAGGCSGLGFMLVSLSLAGYILLSTTTTHTTKILAILTVIFWAMLTNWVRICLIILAGYEYGMDHPLVQEHVTFGWFVYAIIMMPLILFGTRWIDRQALKLESSAESAQMLKPQNQLKWQ